MWAGVAVAAVAAGYLLLRPDAMVVDVAQAVLSPMHVTVEEDGRTRVKDRFLVTAPITGNMLRLALDPGDPVEAGQALAFMGPATSPLLDARSRAAGQARLAAARAALEQANAAISRGEAARSAAEEEVARERVMLELGTGTPYRLRQAELRYQAREEELHSARFGAEVARHEVENARVSLRQLDSGGPTGEIVISAPVEGKVLRILNEGGGLVQAGTPILELGDPRTLEVVVDVLTSDAVRIEPGCHVALTRWGGTTSIRGAVHQVEPSAFTKVSALGVEEQRVNVIVDLIDRPTEGLPLGDGYQVDVAIIVWEGTVLNVPSGAVFPLDEGWAVYVVEDGKARLMPVTIGERNADRVEIMEGVSEDDTVIVYAGDSIRDGVRVRAAAR